MAKDFLTQIDMNSLKIVNVATPTGDADAATKAYVDSMSHDVVGHLEYKGVLDASTYTNELDSGAAGDFYVISVAGTMLGVEMAVGDMLLLNSATTTATSADFDKIDNTDLSESQIKALVSGGDALTYNSSTGVFDVNVDDSTIEITGDILNVKDLGITSGKLATDSITTAKISTGAVTTDELGTDSVTAAKINSDVAGTGLTQNVTSGAIELNSSSFMYSETIGDNSATQITVTHGLGTEDVIDKVRALVSGVHVECDCTVIDSNNVRFDFAVAPTTDAYRVVIMGM